MKFQELMVWLRDGRIGVGEDGCLEVLDKALHDELYKPQIEFSSVEEYFNQGAAEEMVSLLKQLSIQLIMRT